MKKIIILLVIALYGMSCSAEIKKSSIVSQFDSSGQVFTTKTIDVEGCNPLTVIMFKHATLGFVWNDKVIYVDPLTNYADFSKLPKADMILVTHEHFDHLDSAAINAARGENSIIRSSSNVSKLYPGAVAVAPGDTLRNILPQISVIAISAYNVSPDKLQFHPKERGDDGFIIEFGKTRVYVSGDSEPIEEMKTLGNIDLAFLAVNQPYTMTIDQAVEASSTIGAKLFIPYHTGDTDMERLRSELTKRGVRFEIVPMN